jgi:hypothetical protein
VKRDPLQQRLYEASGKAKSNDKLVCFLYLLMRDHLPNGVVLRTVMESQDEDCDFTNGWMVENAQWLADQLRQKAASPPLSSYRCDRCQSIVYYAPGKKSVACKWGRCNGTAYPCPELP